MNVLSQSQLQKMLQRLSPQQIQMIKLLELPTAQLEQRIKNEIEENPALEEEIESLAEHGNKDVDIEEYKRREEIPAYRLQINNSSKDDKLYVVPLSDGLSLTEFLNQQLSYLNISKKTFDIAKYIIGSLDRNGYLNRTLESIADDLIFNLGIEASDEEVLEALHDVQSLEPHGIAARNVQESLSLQLHFLPQSETVILAQRIVKDFFEELAKKHYDKLVARLGVGNQEFRNAISAITSLSPKPANLYAEQSQSEPTVQITPDFVLENTDNGFEISLNRGNYCEIKLNKSYLDLLETLVKKSKQKSADNSEVIIKGENKEAVNFIRQKVDSAKWFISAVKQRNVTLMITVNAIINFQEEYFKTSDETKLRPMILKDISDITHFDVSTISRVVNSKYIQTEFGIFSLKYFFSEAMHTNDGEQVSSREIKAILQECVDYEDKKTPLTDEALMIILQDKGYKIARRTVAKYREMLGIRVARMRKEY